jgi:hypothetical protein
VPLWFCQVVLLVVVLPQKGCHAMLAILLLLELLVLVVILGLEGWKCLLLLPQQQLTGERVQSDRCWMHLLQLGR